MAACIPGNAGDAPAPAACICYIFTDAPAPEGAPATRGTVARCPIASRKGKLSRYFGRRRSVPGVCHLARVLSLTGRKKEKGEPAALAPHGYESFAAGASGKLTRNSAPCSGSDSIVISARWCSRITDTNDSPRPMPVLIPS